MTDQSLALRAELQHRITRIAVGTALAGGPPRRSQRAELPHWAPGSGQTSHGPTPRSDVINVALPPAPVGRTRSGTCGTPDPALCPGRVVPSGFPSPRPLPSTASAAVALFGGFVGTTRRSDFPRSYIPGVRPQPSLGGPTPISGTGERGISRFSRMKTPYMQRFSDRAGSADGSRRERRRRCCLPLIRTASAPRNADFAAP